MSIQWYDCNNLDSEDDEDYQIDSEIHSNETMRYDSVSTGIPIIKSVDSIKIEPLEPGKSISTGTKSLKSKKVKCDVCKMSIHVSSYERHRLTCSVRKCSEKVSVCQFCSKKLLAVNLSRHFSTCRGLNRENTKVPTSKHATPRFSSRKVIDITENLSSQFKSRTGNDSGTDGNDGEQNVVCPECLKRFSDNQGRDEHLVYHHHYHFRIRFGDREDFKKWFRGMRFDQIMYKANMSTVNGVTYEYYFCLYTAVNRRVRIRDRCPCRAFVKENASGITVSYLDVHSHPQLQYKRYMTEDCRDLILKMLERGCKNKEILNEVRDRFGESSINYTIARTTINSIRFKYKKKVWAARNVDIEELKRSLADEVAHEKEVRLSRLENDSLSPEGGSKVITEVDSDHYDADDDDNNFSMEHGTQTEMASLDRQDVSLSTVSTREEKEKIVNYIIHQVLPSLESSVRNPHLSANQLHSARIHLSKVIQDLNPSTRKDSDHDYTYLSAH